jgi:hypothetical protein
VCPFVNFLFESLLETFFLLGILVFYFGDVSGEDSTDVLKTGVVVSFTLTLRLAAITVISLIFWFNC